MKNFILLLSTIIFTCCSSQNKISLKQMNESLLKDNYIYYNTAYMDSTLIRGIKNNFLTYRLVGAKSCNISPDKKYSHIYIEDGFHDEQGFYNGMIIVDNEFACEITTSPYKLRLDSLSYNEIKIKIKETDFIFYTKKVSIQDVKKDYPDEYFRYELVKQNKVDNLKKCFEIDQYTPKSPVYVKNYYFTNKKIVNYDNIRIKYTDIKDGIDGMPYLKEDKKKEFFDCINQLNILHVQMK
ncbi:hypothetical protein CRH01_21700 [Chryseobacterium rhizosphaerae]|nr:hypothetical protein CRH01_21700 [Chryseobacterium rhizosphaerae]